jgi:hypothetical protein
LTKEVAKWRPVIAAELARSGYPLPPELIEAVLSRESGGSVGVINHSSGASGLMQVMPIALRDYNQHHRRKYTMSDLRSKTTAGAQIQIRVGLWILARFWRGAFRYMSQKINNVEIDDLARIADIFYASGPGNAKKKLDQIVPTFDNAKARFPNWDRIIPAQRILDYVAAAGGQWDVVRIGDWLKTGKLIEQKKTAIGAAVGVLIIAVALWYFQRGRK